MEIDLDRFWEENIFKLNEIIAIYVELQYINIRIYNIIYVIFFSLMHSNQYND